MAPAQHVCPCPRSCPTLGPNQEGDKAQGPSPSSAQDHPEVLTSTQTTGAVCWPRRLEPAQTAPPQGGQKAAHLPTSGSRDHQDGAWAQEAAEVRLEALMADAGRRPARLKSPPPPEAPGDGPGGPGC